MTKEDLEQLAAGYRNHRGEFINVNLFLQNKVHLAVVTSSLPVIDKFVD